MLKKIIFRICTGSSCRKKFSQYIWERANTTAKKLANIEVETCGCQGRCKDGPTVIIQANKHKKILKKMNPITTAHIMKNIGKTNSNKK